mmetsp:Transcript_24309/g.53055  ORF Transcript_24309/g.53055 Transcript_24309/m.53055 type:complete len:94 (+) Transcript_24309:81-362(+)|eukprot:CAMPEP_0118933164 /NCGR_PEP_ID=MMETSP1169-20130426/11478_1 /TAXON_ID=36882 /ORGANISM="Pyramimonas obovata, Strain CCMP722" /LENGTH=93 /DNA_ID=CAMNT_0006875897 /DNA_START=44 /DNA_END=325 /DNA_ORIENTATION=+
MSALFKNAVSKSVQELRLHFCQTSAESKQIKDFVIKNYKSLKAVNPSLPILVRECEGVSPKLWVRFDMGVEKSQCLKGMDEKAIMSTLETMTK